MGIFQILKNKVSRSIFWISAIKKTSKIWDFLEFFHFYPTLDYHKIRTRTNFENPNGKNLDLHLIMWFTLKQLLPDSTDFTEAIFKIPQISKHFSAMLRGTPKIFWYIAYWKNFTSDHSFKVSIFSQHLLRHKAALLFITHTVHVCTWCVLPSFIFARWR